MRAWIEQKKAMTREKIAKWNAVAAMGFAAAALDEAERAAVEAVVARLDADAAQPLAASKSA